ncbi:MAG: hypothetical protein U0R78_14640 [Nocardioidaceae bacterium]
MTATDSTDTTLASTPAITLDKQAGAITDVDGNGQDAGDTILYSFVITNTGNVTLTLVGVTDAKVGPVTCPVTTLAPGASTTCTKSYTLTQADVDAGVVNNTATALGHPAHGCGGDRDRLDLHVDHPDQEHHAGQAGRHAGSSWLDGGFDVIAYSFVITNAGNVTLTSVGISDAKVGPVTCAVTALAPGVRPRRAPRPTRSPRPTLTPWPRRQHRDRRRVPRPRVLR